MGDSPAGFLDQTVLIGEQFSSVHAELVGDNTVDLVVLVGVPVVAGDAQIFIDLSREIVHVVSYPQYIQHFSSPQNWVH